ncbi:DRB0094 family RNA ligase [Apiospora rasikravindrae]|uniref:DRB0094 family RNA ligase n=1 Tax=Apiospora rasikravindrae TaxID=990691 RepID=A0ABR1U9Y1_9PEZI
MARNLASVRQISHLRPLGTSSGLLLAEVDGWKCAMKQGTAKVGDHIVYFEIDTFLPVIDTRFASLGQLNAFNGSSITWDGRLGFHITSIIAELGENNTHEETMQKVMSMPFEDELNVLKWESAAVTKKKPTENSLGPPPCFSPRRTSSESRTAPTSSPTSTRMPSSRRPSRWTDAPKPSTSSVATRPCTPPSAPLEGRADMPEGRFGICTRNHELPDKPECLFWRAAQFYRLPQKLAALGKNLAIQGELCGSSLNKNHEGFPEGKHDFYVYRIFDIDAQEALGLRETKERARQLGLKHVPVNGYFRLHDIAASNEELLKRAEGVGIFGKPREGACVQERGGWSWFQGHLQLIPARKRGVEVVSAEEYLIARFSASSLGDGFWSSVSSRGIKDSSMGSTSER